MSQSNGLNPQYAGLQTQQGLVNTFVPVNGTNIRYAKHNTVVVLTNGTTEVNVFGPTNGFAGTFLGARIISRDDANGNITLQNNPAGTATTIFTIAKGSEGGVKGSYFSHVAFSSGGTATIKSSAATGQAIVELDFIASNPQLPGAQ